MSDDNEWVDKALKENDQNELLFGPSYIDLMQESLFVNEDTNSEDNTENDPIVFMVVGVDSADNTTVCAPSYQELHFSDEIENKPICRGPSRIKYVLNDLFLFRYL